MITYSNEVPPPGEFIREELDARDWSQRDLADALKQVNDSLSEIRVAITKLAATSEQQDALLRRDVDLVLNWIRKQDPSFPGGSKKNLTAPAPPSPPASVAQIDDEPPQSQTPARRPRGIPSSVKPTSPPDCVHSGTFRRFPCEQAKQETCYGLRGFNPKRYAEIREKSGAGEYMLVCDEK